MNKQIAKRKILVTGALPYANGSIHLGHLVGYIQADIWTRFQKMRGHECTYICGIDAHGTPIMIKAEQMGITPEQLIQHYQDEHKQDFQGFNIKFDNYYTTHSSENRSIAEYIYKRLLERGDIQKRTIRQAFDPIKQMFLPDRYVKGNCPRCNAPSQYGDSCEVCGATYTPTELKNPVSVISGATPIEKESEHYFFQLQHYADLLKTWMSEHHVSPQIIRKLQEWFTTGLQDWDISRDAPYFGFEIPDHPGKYFYVWLDAPVGYMASFQNLCNQKEHLNFDEYWRNNKATELYHFIGKDIIYFHCLFWPAMLAGAGFRLPTGIFVNGYLTVGGQKMSKSRGTFIQARTYLQVLNPEYLRYYFAAKLNSYIEDIDLNFDDFIARVNSDLVGKIINIASRCARFINNNFSNRLSPNLSDLTMVNHFIQTGNKIAELYEAREFAKAIREVMNLADLANQMIDEKKPWVLIKNDEQAAHEVCSAGINLFKLIMLYLKPILPSLAEQVEKFLKISPMNWENQSEVLLDHEIDIFTPLLKRINPQQIEQLKELAMNDTLPTHTPTQTPPTSASTLPLISIDDFNKVDLRVALIVKAEPVEGADKLVRLELSLGEEGTKQVFAGIKSAYTPEQLEGRLTLMIANLEPRKMRFGISEGMVLVAGDGIGLWLLSPDSGAKPGMRVK